MNDAIDRSDFTLVILSDSLQFSGIQYALVCGLKKMNRVILIHDVNTRFPSVEEQNIINYWLKWAKDLGFKALLEYYPNIVELLGGKGVDFSSIFTTIAIPMIDKYEEECWKKIKSTCDKRSTNHHNEVELEDISTDVFLSHKQSTGQGIALPLQQRLKEVLGLKVFLDVQSDFELHDLNKLIDQTKLFVFIYTEGILDSQYCFEEFKHAVKSQKKIIILRHYMTVIPEIHDMPIRWREYKYFFERSDNIRIYHASILGACAQKIVDSITNEDTDQIFKYPDYKYYYKGFNHTLEFVRDYGTKLNKNKKVICGTFFLIVVVLCIIGGVFFIRSVNT